MPDQVIRYESEQQYLDFKNQHAHLSGGRLMGLPSWEDDPDSYWESFYAYKHAHSEQMFSWQTILIREQIIDGVLERQRIKYHTLMFENAEAYRANREHISANIQPDPGTPVSAKFETKAEAEKMRHLLLHGEPGYYYGIKHFTRVCVIEGEHA